MEIHNALQNLGLNDKEAKVYSSLVQLGQSSAYGVASKSNLKKPTTYVVLEELIKKGFVRKIPRKRKALFEAKPPEEVFTLAKEKLEIAEKALPELMALKRGEEKKIKALYFEGVHGIKQMLEYRIKEMKGSELVGFYATDDNFNPDTKETFDHYFKKEWNEKMLKLKITMRGVAPESPSMKPYREVDEKYGRKVKIIPYNLYSSDTAIDVIGDIVRIQDYKNTQGVLIENPDVAKTIREIFELVWSKKV